MGMNWLITGGCGFLGVSFINKLISIGGHKVIVLDNLSGGSRNDLAAVCQFMELTSDGSNYFSKLNESHPVGLIVGDILDGDLAIKITKGANVIIHFAANTGVPQSIEQPRLDMENNVIGTFNYLEAARQNAVGRFVFSSSGAPAGEVEPPIHEELAPHPVSPYGASKLAGEGYCSAYAKSYGVQTVCLRFGNVYGPRSGHKGSVVAKFLRLALAGGTLEIYGDGFQTRDYIFIDDLVEAVFKAATLDDIGGETFQIATESETTINELLEKIGVVFNELSIPIPDIIYTEQRKGDVKRNYSDTSKAKRLLNWQSETDLLEGLRSTIEFFMTHTSTVQNFNGKN